MYSSFTFISRLQRYRWERVGFQSPSSSYTSAIPTGILELVLRISKNNVDLEDSVRIRNEVAFLP